MFLLQARNVCTCRLSPSLMRCKSNEAATVALIFYTYVTNVQKRI